MIRNSGGTLEVFRFADEKGLVNHRRHMMDRIPSVLRNCPRLRMPQSRHFGSKANVGVSFQGLTWRPWVAKELETLETVIRDIDWDRIKYDKDESEEEIEDYDTEGDETDIEFDESDPEEDELDAEEEDLNDEEDGFDFKPSSKGLFLRRKSTAEETEAWAKEK
ncbi:hypothetical protein BGX33_010938 [Mortierella sp. NVP41]|nr:hypothetical protein BGX33_010938 [Mortierella sp. NVP41]